MQDRIICRCSIFTAIAISGLFTGCIQYRVAYTPMVPDQGPRIETKNKYKIATWLCRFEDGTTHCMDMKWIGLRNEAFASCLPGVFSLDGVPVRIIENMRPAKSENWGAWTILVPCIVSAFTLPCYAGGDAYRDYEFEFDGKLPNASVQVRSERTTAITPYSPIALLLPMSDYEPEPGRRAFSEHGRKFLGDPPDALLRDRAVAYGLATRLKEMEDAGKVTVGTSQNRQGEIIRTGPQNEYNGNPSKIASLPLSQSGELPQAENPNAKEANTLYNILSCKRETGSDFAYRFELELLGKNSSLRTFRMVQQEFRKAVKEDYVESTPGAESDNLYVEFPEYELKGGKIEGRAVVLTISVTSLTYDPNTRTGKLAVKVNANQYEEARKWVRKNIETLARDKNIALTTGEIPPAAKFYLGREELKDGNVLEIEFKTE